MSFHLHHFCIIPLDPSLGGSKTVKLSDAFGHEALFEEFDYKTLRRSAIGIEEKFSGDLGEALGHLWASVCAVVVICVAPILFGHFCRRLRFCGLFQAAGHAR